MGNNVKIILGEWLLFVKAFVKYLFSDGFSYEVVNYIQKNLISLYHSLLLCYTFLPKYFVCTIVTNHFFFVK